MKEGSGCLSWIISKYLEYLQYLKYLGYLEEVKCGECFAMVNIVSKKALAACPGNCKILILRFNIVRYFDIVRYWLIL